MQSLFDPKSLHCVGQILVSNKARRLLKAHHIWFGVSEHLARIAQHGPNMLSPSLDTRYGYGVRSHHISENGLDFDVFTSFKAPYSIVEMREETFAPHEATTASATATDNQGGSFQS